MSFFLGLAAITNDLLSLVTLDFERMGMYGLLALVVGLIAWSKYNEPPLSDPYAKPRSDRNFPETSSRAELGPAVPVRAEGASGTRRAAAGKRPPTQDV